MVYRDAFMECVCGGRFTTVRWRHVTYDRCRDCAGVRVTHEDLLTLWRGMDGASPIPALVPRPRPDGHRTRPCVICRTPMEQVEILVVPVDLCAQHGYWFDRDELSTVLAAAAFDTETWFETFVDKLVHMR